MSLDLRGRAAADAVHRATRQDVDVHARLDQLHQHHRRRIGGYVAVAAAVVLALCLGALTWSTWHPHASAPSVTQPSPTIVREDFALTVPFTAVRPDGWTQVVEKGVIAVLNSPKGPYLEVVINPSPVATGGSPAPPTLTAESLSRWIAARRELEPTTAVRTTLAGLPAWRVDVKLRPGFPATATCDGTTDTCLPLVRAAGIADPLGVVPGSAGRVFVVQLPDGRIVGVAAGGSTRNALPEILAAVQPILNSLSFSTTG